MKVPYHTSFVNIVISTSKLSGLWLSNALTPCWQVSTACALSLRNSQIIAGWLVGAQLVFVLPG